MTAWYDYMPVGDFGKTFAFATYPVQGEDIPMPQDTPVTALFSGTVANLYYDAGGGQVIIQADDPSQLQGIPYYYYVHLDNFAQGLTKGSSVARGQLVGYSGGQNTGGSHPAAPNYSSGPHLEIGESKTPSIPFTLAQITPDLNPDWLLGYAKKTGLSFQASSGKPACQCPAGYHVVPGAQLPGGSDSCSNGFQTAPCSPGTGTQATNPLDMINAFFNNIKGLTEWLKNPQRIIKVIAGILLLGIAIYMFANPSIAAKVTKPLRRIF